MLIHRKNVAFNDGFDPSPPGDFSWFWELKLEDFKLKNGIWMKETRDMKERNAMQASEMVI